MYVVKKNKRKIKINKQKGNKQKKKNKKKLQINFIRQFGSVFNKNKWLNPLYICYSAIRQGIYIDHKPGMSHYIDHKPGMSHYIPCLIAE